MSLRPTTLWQAKLVVVVGLSTTAAALVGCDGGTSSGLPGSVHGGAGGVSAAAASVNGAGAPGTNGGASGAAVGVGISGGGGTAVGGGNAGGGGTDGAAGTGDALGSVFGAGLPEVSADGDGERTIGPNFADDPLTSHNGDLPEGKRFSFEMASSESAIYPGINGPFKRKVDVYVPAPYVAGTAAPFMVSQDAIVEDKLPTTVDNLIALHKLPVLVLIFVNNGGGDAQGSERGLEYDTVSGRYAEFVDREVLPRVVSEAKTQLDLQLSLTSDPNGRGTFGASSGGAAAFSMVWWHPDLFRRALTYSGTFVSQITEPTPFPHGCWVYHDIDPHFGLPSEAPHGLLVEHCWNPLVAGVGDPGPCDTPLSKTACESVSGCAWNTQQNKPVRVWLESGERDNGTPGAELNPKYGAAAYRDFNLANRRMAAAFAARGYHYHYDYAVNAYHSDGRVMIQTLPEALQWVWRGYPTN